MAEWLGRGLQNLVQQFESARDLTQNPASLSGIFCFIQVTIYTASSYNFLIFLIPGAMQSNKWSFKIDKKLYVIFILLIVITLANAFISTYIIDKSKNITIEIAEVTTPSQSAISDLTQLVNNSWLQATNVAFRKNKAAAISELQFINETQYPALKKELKRLSESWQQKEQLALIGLFEKYDRLIYFESQLIEKARVSTENNVEILETQITPQVQEITALLSDFNIKKRTETTAKQKEMIQSFIVLMAVVLGLAMVIINFIIVITLFLNKQVVNPLMKIRRYLLQLGKGELPELNIKTPKNAVGEMIDALKMHVSGLNRTAEFANNIGQGKFDYHFEPLSENDVQGKALLDMRSKLKAASEEDASQKWISEGLERISVLNKDYTLDMQVLCNNLIKEVVEYSSACHGTVFLLDTKDESLHEVDLKGIYCRSHQLTDLHIEWIKHQLVKKCIDNNERIETSLLFDIRKDGENKSMPCSVFVMPLFASGRVIGALEIASLNKLTASGLNYLQRLIEPVSASIYAVYSNALTRELLEESIMQSEELVAQKQELAQVNQNLTIKSEELEISQKELKKQQEELKAANINLEIKAHLLEERSLAVEEARQSLAFKATQLEQTNKFKSAFLANMSHELRTPLNSILILAKLLAGNKNKNLTDKQIEHASVIHKSGSDLLLLINDILDISKIESGKLEFVFEKMNIETVANDINLLFKEFASEKQINFQVKVWDNCYPEMVSDKLRLEQVIKNLISNALKFTDKNGHVSLDFRKATTEDCKTHNLLFEEDIIAISVTDSGIGIPVEKQKQVFEAFKQADNSTSRKYGGTGLGLTISREIVQILGGEIVLESTPGKGSTFTVFIPFFASCESKHDNPVKKVITQAETEKQETENTKKELPLINTIVSKFPDNDFTDDRNFITPFDKVILILEKDITFLKTLIDYCHIFNYKAIASQNGETGILLAKSYHPHFILLDHNLPDIDGGTLLKNIRSEQKLCNIPIHIISELKPTQGLINEFNITAFHHKPLNKKQLENVMNQLQAPENIPQEEAVVEHAFHESSLSGKTILMADDDLRNIYALTTLIESAGANLIYAYDGKEAINKLEKNPHVDIVLMDDLMPVMNGVDAIAEIRKTAQFRNIPVLAVLSGSDAQEKEKCLHAGATDTLSRPLNNDQILNKIKFLLYQ